MARAERSTPKTKAPRAARKRGASAATLGLRELVEAVGATRQPPAPPLPLPLPRGELMTNNPSWRAADAALAALGDDDFALRLFFGRALATRGMPAIVYALRAVAGGLENRSKRQPDYDALRDELRENLAQQAVRSDAARRKVAEEILARDELWREHERIVGEACEWLLVALEHHDQEALAAFDAASRFAQTTIDPATVPWNARLRATGLRATVPIARPRTQAAYGRWLVGQCEHALRMYHLDVAPLPAGVTHDPLLDLRNLTQRLCGFLWPRHIEGVRGMVASRARLALQRARLLGFDARDRYTDANPLWRWLWREHPSETGIDAKGLAAGALRACGVANDDAWNIVDGAARANKRRRVTRKK